MVRGMVIKRTWSVSVCSEIIDKLRACQSGQQLPKSLTFSIYSLYFSESDKIERCHVLHMDAAILKNSKSAYCRSAALLPAAAAEFSMAQAVCRRSIKIRCYNSGSCCSDWPVLSNITQVRNKWRVMDCVCVCACVLCAWLWCDSPPGWLKACFKCV